MLGWLYFVICAITIVVTYIKGSVTLFYIAGLIAIANIVSFEGTLLLKQAKGSLMYVRDTCITLHFGSSLSSMLLLTYTLVVHKH